MIPEIKYVVEVICNESNRSSANFCYNLLCFSTKETWAQHDLHIAMALLYVSVN